MAALDPASFAGRATDGRRDAMSGTRAAAERWEIELDYPIRPEPRYGYERQPHQRLHALLDASREAYARVLNRFLTRSDELLAISTQFTEDPRVACWTTGWLGGLDIVSLYGLLSDLNPRHYI